MPDEVTAWLAGRAIPLAGVEPATVERRPRQSTSADSGPVDLAPLHEVFAGVRAVGLGEATHGSAEFFTLRWRLTEFLIKELGFTTLAIEASAAAARAVDDYVRGESGDAREALAGLGFWTLNTAEMLEVIERLREHNRTAARPVRFAGVDPQHPAASLRTLRACVGGAAAALLDTLDDIGRLDLRHHKPLDRQVEADARRLEEDIAAHGPAEARHHARIVRQFAELATRPFTHPDSQQTIGFARDRHMAENVNLLMADPDARVVVWAHNGHVMKGNYSGGAVPAMGRHLAREHGPAYYALAALFGEGGFRANRMRFGRLVGERRPEQFRVPRATAPRVVETRLAAACPGDYVVDLRSGGRPASVDHWLAEANHMRAFGAAAGRFTAKFAFMPVVLSDHFDGVAFVRETTPSTPL
ncbi:erythromycin esterase family protein [Nonomuraea sp. SYSU D8015]|uniref:erythromycin esterase family protein n=1 Tax=Nonomuraea sp. SYSU D8015 TaxID=2593644 RepID=UPI001CB6F9EE|nr:erythromycin esterase family protein [Nonomuraea sp. SYSU D8015]